MSSRYSIRAALIFFAAAAGCILLSGTPARALTAEVTPQDIPITFLYNGADVSIRGTVDPHDDVIVRISSEPTDAHMKYKGKAAGLFWMKMGDMSFEHVPSVYLLYSSRELATLLQAAERVREGIGFESVKAGATMESSAAGIDPDRWIMEFIKFKQAEKVYQIRENAVKQSQGANGSRQYQLDLRWPYQAAPGTYNIEVFAVRDGKVVDRSESSLTVARAGIVAKLSNLAFNHAAVYGIISILVAMAAGFAVGALFKKGGGAH